MKRTLVRYKARPEQADENQRLIEAVFSELRAKAPQDIRYLVLRLADGSFVHLKTDDGVIHELDAFRSFQAGIKDRCAEPPVAMDATIVGNYRLLDPS